jgi:F-type H+-transporting ATPase subunit epsilon
MSDKGQATIRLKVIAPDRLLAEADVESVSLPSLEGEIGVLPGHRPLFVGIGQGRLTYRSGGEEESVSVRGGYAQVLPEEVTVMTDAGPEDKGSGNEEDGGDNEKGGAASA